MNTEKQLTQVKTYLNKNELFAPVFNAEYLKPGDFLKDITALYNTIPNPTHSLSILSRYYAVFKNRSTTDQMLWYNYGLAFQLMQESSVWKRFFKTKFTTAGECINNVPPESKYSLSTIIMIYLAYNSDLGHHSWSWFSYMKIHQLIDSDPEWKKFFHTEYKNPANCIKAIPQNTGYSISTIMGCYLLLHESNTTKKREWVNTANAYCLYDQNDTWKNFFDTAYTTPESLISSIPDLCNHSISTVMTYYFLLNKLTTTRKRSWVITASALDLYNSSSHWNLFFDSTYTTPLECIKAIPKSSQHSYTTILNYYFVFHPKQTSVRREWVDTGKAYSLSLNDKQWNKFLNTEFGTPFECIKNVPKGAEQSLSTIINYYLCLNKKKTGDTMKWIYAANTVSLYNNDADWKKFFDHTYKDPFEMLQSIPRSTIITKSTAYTYYTIFNNNIDYSWMHLVKAIVFLEKNPELFDIHNNTFFWDQIECLQTEHSLPGYETWRKYRSAVNKYNVTIDNIIQFGNFLPIVKEHPDLRTWLLDKFGEIKTRAKLKNIIDDFKESDQTYHINNVPLFIQTMYRYYNTGLFEIFN